MLEKMEGKGTAELPTITIQQERSENDSSDRKKWTRAVTRKQVIVGVSAVVVAALVIAGILVGVKFFLDSTNNIVTRSFEFKAKDKEGNDDGDRKVNEDVSVDLTDNLVDYHLKDGDSEIWVIDDFNRELQTIKVKSSAGSSCYVAHLNSSDSALPESILNATSQGGDIETQESYYEASEKPIKDTSMLSKQAQKLCANHDIYWLTETCQNGDKQKSESSGLDRQKRRVCCRYFRYCYYYRYWYYWRYRCYYYRRCYYC